MAKQDVTVELLYSGQWNDHTAATLVRDDISISYGRENESGQPAPSTAKLTFTGWRFNPRNPSSDLHGLIGRNTPLRVSVGGFGRFRGEVASWTPRQSLGGDQVPPDRWVEVVAAGVTRRLGQGADPLRTALTRAAPEDAAVVAHWPLAGLGQDVAEAPSSIRGRAPMVVRPTSSGDFALSVRWSADATAPGLGACPTTTGSFSGLGLTGATPTTSPPVGWSMWGRGEGNDDLTSQFTMWIDTSLTSWLLWVLWAGASEQITVIAQARDAVGNLLADLSNTNTIPLTDRFEHFAAVLDQSGTDADLTVLRNGDEIAMTLNSGSLSGITIGSVFQTRATGTITNAARGMSIGHPTVLTAATTGDVVAAVQRLHTAGRGHVGESAGRRLFRLTDEEGVPLVFIGSAHPFETQPAGPQYPDGLLPLLRGMADLDHGILVEDRVLEHLTYRPGRDLYNQDAGPRVLDYDAGQVAPPLDPTLDDQRTRNDVTVKRRGGGEVRVTLDAGPMSTQPPPDGVGRVQESVTVGTMSDGLLGDQAGWRLHLGTVDEIRTPKLTVDLDASPELVGVASSLRLGDRVVVTNLPPELSPDALSLLVQGYTETIGSHRRKITFNCVPEVPYHIAEVEHPDYATIGSDAATTAQLTITETDTDFRVNAGAGPDWVHEVDFEILIGGERMTVTAVLDAGGTFPNRLFDLTVIRSVNGVVKAHGNDAPIEFFHKSYIGL